MSFQGDTEIQGFTTSKQKTSRPLRKRGRGALRALENELQTARELARDAGHDIRNALNTQRLALHSVCTWLQRLPPGEFGQLQSCLIEAQEQSDFIEQLVLEFCTLSNAGAVARPMTRVQDSVAQALQVLGRQAPKNCQIIARLKPRQRFPVEPIKLLRVLVNLLQNAFHSLTEKSFEDGRPMIWIEAGQEKSKNWLSVSDNGAGIDPANLDKIFDTSFTTKRTGLGLGLGICRKAIRDAGGEISVRSTLGDFAEFTISFPRRSGKSKA